MADAHKNFAYSTVAVAPSPATSGATLEVQPGEGDLFPTPPFNATVWPRYTQPTAANAEIVRVTAIIDDAFTITRAQEGTNARSIASGFQIMAGVTAKTLTDAEAPATTTTSGIIKLSGDLMGTATNPRTKVRTAYRTVGVSDANADYIATGTADNTAIQGAIDAVSAAGGGTVCIQRGTYIIAANIRVPSNVTLAGEGNGTVLRAVAGLAGTTNLIVNYDTSGGNTGIIIRDLKIEGNRANRTGSVGNETGHNIFLKRCTYSTVQNVTSSDSFSGNVVYGPGTNNSIIENCYTSNAGNHNIMLVGSETGPTYTYENIIRGCTSDLAGVTGTFGVGIELAVYAWRNTVTGNVSKNSDEGGIHVFLHSNYNTISNNVIKSTGQNGISIVDESNHNVISDNIIVDIVNVGIGTLIAYLTAGGSHNIVTGNQIINCGWNGIRGDFPNGTISNNLVYGCGTTGTSTQGYGMYLTSADNLKLSDNKVISSFTRGIHVADLTNAIVTGNYVGSSGNLGFAFDYASVGLTDSIVTGNLAENNNGNGFVFLGQVRRSQISGNVARSNHQNGIDIRGATDCVISDNICTNNTFVGIALKNDIINTPCTKCLVVANNCTTNVEGGIVESGTADNNVYTNNAVINNTLTANNMVVVGSSSSIINTNGSTNANGLAKLLPSQTGNSGKVLSTNGTAASWTTAASGDMAAATYDPAGVAQQLVGTSATQTLTNKNLTSGTNTFPTFNQNTTGTAAGLTGKTTPSGALVGDTDTQTLTNKTLTTPKIDTINDTNGVAALGVIATASAVNYVSFTNAITAGTPIIQPAGSDSNINLSIRTKGTGLLTIRPGSNGTSSFAVQNASGTTFIRGDSTNGWMGVGPSAAAPTSTLFVGGSLGSTLTSTATNLTLNATHQTVEVTAAAGITLPTAASITGRVYDIINAHSAAITITANGAQTIGNTGAAANTYSLPAGEGVTLVSNGSNWRIK